jgi:hypothetical protein
MNKHRSGNPRLFEQHKKIQHEGDKELKGQHPAPDRPTPGKGKPDEEEGVGTQQNQKR